MKLLFQILLYLLISYLTACSNTNNKDAEPINIKKPETMYSEALIQFENDNIENNNFISINLYIV